MLPAVARAPLAASLAVALWVSPLAAAVEVGRAPADTASAPPPTMPTPQEPAPGIARELARARAESLAEVEYDVRLTLDKGVREVEGWIEVRFSYAGDEDPTEDVILDFDGMSLDDVLINEVPQDRGVRRVHGHVVLPAETLSAGRNSVQAAFKSKVAATGTPLTVYRDPADGAEYFYTLVVPADAHRLFPCFDQPDLKAKVRFTLDIPSNWVAVANGPIDEDTAGDAMSRDFVPRGKLVKFSASQPISTYLMAFAAGPFAITRDSASSGIGTDPRAPLRLIHRKSRSEDLDADTLFKMHRDGLRWLEEYFGVDYPFAKLDLVLVPGFPYGGMEHAGAIFYRERSLVFDSAPTEAELTRRSTLIYHELSHQWFGNLVTMEWFDDLWLKEGFATFIAYRCMSVIEPQRRSWLRFHQGVKPRAYQVDATTGTTPVFQQLANLADAKSAYGAIVYNKAPAVLRQLDAQLGEDRFRAGMTRFLERHAYANARWQDLVTALEEVANTDLNTWSARWILAPGMPQVRVAWTVEAGVVREAWVEQQAAQGTAEPWPLRLQLLVWPASGDPTTVDVVSTELESPIPELIGQPPPRCVLLNPGDEAYGQFLVDTASRDFLVANVGKQADPLVRAVALSALWDTVREAQMDPLVFARMAVGLLAQEQDPESHAWLLARISTCLGRYMPPARGAALRRQVTQDLLRALDAGLGNRAVPTFRFLMRSGDGEGVHELCERVAGGDGPPGMDVGKRDRFLACARLLADGDPAPLAALEQELAGEDVAKDAYLAHAAAADAANKEQVFSSYLDLEAPPEQWVQDSLAFFHWPGQHAQTLPFLERALEKLEWVKEHRKIFFMPAWIDGFVNGHSTADALEIVDAVLARDDLSDDIRRKLLQSADGLRRAVRIRDRW